MSFLAMLVSVLVLVPIGACGFVGGDDSHAGDDSAPDAGSRGPGDAGAPGGDAGDAGTTVPTITLRATADDVDAGTADACAEVTEGLTTQQTYQRAMPLADFAAVPHGDSLHLTAMTFAVHAARAASGVTVQVGIYADAIDAGTPTLDPAAITWLSAAIPIAIADGASVVTVPLADDGDFIVGAGGTLVLSVASPDYTDAGGMFEIAGAAGAQTAPSFLGSTACGVGRVRIAPAAQRDPRNNAAVGAFILEATGNVIAGNS